jgi:hypothetical protein
VVVGGGAVVVVVAGAVVVVVGSVVVVERRTVVDVVDSVVSVELAVSVSGGSASAAPTTASHKNATPTGAPIRAHSGRSTTPGSSGWRCDPTGRVAP